MKMFFKGVPKLLQSIFVIAVSLFISKGEVVFAQAPAEQAKTESAADDIDSMNLEDLMNANVTSASKLKQKQSDAPSIISVIPRSQFEQFGWFTLNDAMSAQAGFFPSQDYDRRVIGSRGLFEGWNNNHLLLLMDGVPFNDPMYGAAYTWDNTPVFMIKSVEVIRGPGSALYGSNATNGVISVQTLSGRDYMGKVEARVRAGSERTNWLEAATGNVAGNVNYFMGFSSFETEGNSYESYDGSGSGAKAKIRDDRGTRYFFVKAQGENQLKDFSLQFHDQSWNYQTGHGWLWSIPDFADAMHEHRRILTLSYQPQFSSDFSGDFVLKYERKNIDWNTRYAPDGYSSGTYPNGISEYVNFDFDHFFARGQVTKSMSGGASWLAGLEAQAFVYRGDNSHFSNTDLSPGGSYGPNPGNSTTNSGPILGLIQDKPVPNVGVYTQLVSGDWISSRLPVTLGLRYDYQTVNYDLSKAGLTGEGSRTFQQFSPRLAAVYSFTDRFKFKLLGGQAFRAPAPSELAGVNTWALANNIRNLNPETVTTVEAATDWQATDRFNWRVNAFYTKFEDQIGYSVTAANVSDNIYTTTTVGAETELAYVLPRGRLFGNVSFSKRVDESVSDTTVTANDSEVTWAPWLTANAGVSHDILPGFSGSLLAQFVSEVKRKSSDNATAANEALRGGDVPSWVNVNVGLHYNFWGETRLSGFVKNLLDQEGYLIKNRDYPFDYQVQGMTYYVSLESKF